MAVAAELHEMAPRTKEAEEYGRSLVAMRHAGHLVVDAHVTIETVREDTELYHEFKTAVKEMLKNDPEHHSSLELGNRREHQIINGQTVNANGEPMVDVLQNGVIASKLLVKEDRNYNHQVVRDMCDVKLAQQVDDMPAGTTIWGISKDPSKALEKRPDIYHKRFGYKKGLIYIQTYSKTHENTVKTGSYSVEYKQIDALHNVLAAHGMIIPEDESDDTWLNHAQLSSMSADEAHQFAIDVRREHGLVERHNQSYSVEEFMDEHESILQSIFDNYYSAMAEATVTRRNNETLMDLASTLLKGQSASLRPEIRQQLLVLNNSNRFNDESAKVLDSILRYATAEELRKYLPKLKESPRATPLNHHAIIINTQTGHETDMNARLAQNVYRGVEAGRSYPGCPGNIQLGNDYNESGEIGSDGINHQEAYGGLGKETLLKCVTCPLCKKEGVDAHITYNGDEKTIRCSKCKQSKTYKT